MKYYIPDHGETVADAADCPDMYREHGHDAITAEASAESDWEYADGGNRYPLLLVLVDDTGTESRWRVDIEVATDFHAIPANED